MRKEAPDVQVDAAALEQIIMMGFPENRGKKALIVTGNQGAEAAMNWLFEHMDDPGMRFTHGRLSVAHLT
jgi:ubiquitin carboxyl-terminal hydrolase 5/13